MKIRWIFLILFFFLTSGCEFFGKKDDSVNLLPTGQLPNGQTILGTWSSTSADIGFSSNSDYAINTSFVFEANGAVKIYLKGLLEPRFECSGSGVFRNVSGNDFVVYIQSSQGSCAFNPQMILSRVSIQGLRLQYTNPDTGTRYNLFYSRNPKNAPIGVWNFHSAGADGQGFGGIDYLVFDDEGYFLLFSHDNLEYFMLEGRYLISNGGLSFYFFENEDPNKESSNPMVFSQFLTNGTALILSNPSESGQIINYIGDKL